jgi:DNA-binding MarR family transcriptional regulator
MPITRRQSKKKPSRRQIADNLHSAAIHLLRRLRVADDVSGLSAPRLSALSVVVFAGPVTLSRLAEAEQVKAPTMSRLVGELEAEGLIQKKKGTEDRRRQWITATEKGKRLLEAGKARRIEMLADQLGKLPRTQIQLLGRAANILRRLMLPDSHPRKGKAIRARKVRR